MNCYYLRARQNDYTNTYPLSAFQSLNRSSIGNIYATVGNFKWILIAQTDKETAPQMEEAILTEIAYIVQNHERQNKHNTNPNRNPICIIDLNELVDRLYAKLRLGEETSHLV